MNTAPTAPLRTDRSPATAKVDNLLRQMLKVSDPNDAGQIADGLLKRYADEAGSLERERQGLPVARGPIFSPLATVDRRGTLETSAALDELEIDLREIQTEASTKDTHSELRGIASSIRAAGNDGLAAARMAVDPLQSDRAFGARRKLSEYARVMRYVGALSGNISAMYRRVAKSCDVVSNLILVACGEAMAQGNVTRSTFVRRVPVADMLARRDAAVNALRNLIGSVDTSYGPNDWPRGLEAFRRLNEQLDEAGQSDLRSLFSEADLTHVFDELVDLASSSDSDSLRAVASVATGTLGRIERLIAFSRSPGNIVSPESPPLASYLSALRLFADAFDGSGRGFRLVYVARPPILSYGLYGAAGLDAISRRMLELIQLRNALAEQVDCIMECSCEVDDIRVQLQADKLLFDVDRAIDYYALSDQADGGGLTRSIAYGALSATVSALGVPVLGQQLVDTLDDIAVTLGWPNALPNPGADRDTVANLLHQEICQQQQTEPRWAQLVISLSPRCALDAMISNAPDADPGQTVVDHLLDQAHDRIEADAPVGFIECGSIQIGIPPHHETSLDTIANDVSNIGDGREI